MKKKKLLNSCNNVSVSRGMKADDKKGGGGAHNWGLIKDDTRYNVYLWPS